METSRDREAELLARCVEIARHPDPRPPADQREACVFLLAGFILNRPDLMVEQQRLREAGEAWLAQHPDQRVQWDEKVWYGWIRSFAWLRDSLEHELRRGRPTADASAGMAWWNSLTETDRRHWMSLAGDTGIVADAWTAYNRQSKP